MGNFLSSLIGSGNKPSVYLSVTPGVGLEMCLVDASSKSVKSYSVRPLLYNETTKDIADYEAFKNSIQEMFEELQIDPKCNVVLNLPLCTLGTMNLPLISGDEAITTSVTAGVEQSYLFRRLEPVVSWSDIRTSASANSDTRKILYSAIQKTVVENVSAALGELGATLGGIEVSVVSYLRALDYIGYTAAQMKDNVTWNLMILSSTGYSLLSMVGKNIVDYYEEPLAIKSFEGDDIYNAINASAQITLMSYPANYLYIVSETDMVSAGLLAKKIKQAAATTTIDFFENNSFKKQEVMPVSLEVVPDNVLKISLQAVGCAIADISDYPVRFNFVKSGAGSSDADAPVAITIGDQTFNVIPSRATKLALAIFVAAVGVMSVLAFVVLPNMVASKEAQISDIDSKIKTLDEQLKTVEGESDSTGSFDMTKQVDSVLKSNRSKLMNYSAIGASIPNNVWVTYFVTSDDGLIDVKGAATNVEDIYAFFKNMKDSLINTKLRLHKLQMQTGSVDDLLSNDDTSNYEFEITNMETSQLESLLGKITGDNKAENENKNQNNDKNTKVPDNKLLSDTPVQMN